VLAAVVDSFAPSAELHQRGSIEIEIRLRLETGEAALTALERFDVALGGAVVQDDQAYAPANWDYGQSRLGVTFARLRTMGGKHLFTVKRPLTDVRTCIEYESSVSDRSAMHNAILLMGFRPTIRISKTRRSGNLGGLKVSLDDVHGLGMFLEVEAMAGPGDDVRAIRRDLDVLITKLDRHAKPCYDTYDALIHEAPPQLKLV
jgi:adenylate cyclase, class 2